MLYVLSRMRCSFALSAVWSSWGLWTSGVTLRWLTSVYQWQWRTLLPLSAALELAAFAIFFRTVSGHRPQDSGEANWTNGHLWSSRGLIEAAIGPAKHPSLNESKCFFHFSIHRTVSSKPCQGLSIPSALGTDRAKSHAPYWKCRKFDLINQSNQASKTRRILV